MFFKILVGGDQAFFIMHSEVQFYQPYLLRWCYVILDNFPSCFKVHKLLRMRYLNPLISSLELSCVIFHLKPSLRNVDIVVLINDPSYLSIILVGEVFHLIGAINYIICFRSGRISPQF